MLPKHPNLIYYNSFFDKTWQPKRKQDAWLFLLWNKTCNSRTRHPPRLLKNTLYLPYGRASAAIRFRHRRPRRLHLSAASSNRSRMHIISCCSRNYPLLPLPFAAPWRALLSPFFSFFFICRCQWSRSRAAISIKSSGASSCFLIIFCIPRWIPTLHHT